MLDYLNLNAGGNVAHRIGIVILNFGETSLTKNLIRSLIPYIDAEILIFASWIIF